MATEPLKTEYRWHRSLVVRVALLCAILVVCLFGAVYVLTGRYYLQIVTEVDRRVDAAVQDVSIVIEESGGLSEIDPDMLSTASGADILDVRPNENGQQPDSIRPSLDDRGYGFIVSRTLQAGEGPPVLVTMRFPFEPGAEMLRAFKNRYLLVLAVIFLTTLAALVYLIAQALRPLQQLSETCADISEGNLHDVAVDSSSSEIRVLGDTFNRMVHSLREKQHVEANLRQAQRLSAIGNLAAGVAHDVRNPLNSIKLLSGQALDTLRDNGERELPARHLETIRNEVNRLEEIVSGFLSLAKEEELRRVPTPITPLLDESLALVSKEAEKRNVRMTGELRTHDLELEIDAKQISRALLNVLINAFDACPDGGRVRLFSRLMGPWCEIEVRDDGPGIPPDIIEHVFDPYFTTKTTGTGLGLSITRGIIEEHGGSIEIHSAKDTGTQVIIRLPAV